MEKEVKYCPNCGAEQDLDTKFCTQCGHNFEEEVSEKVDAEEKETNESFLTKFNLDEINLDKFDWKDLKTNKGFWISIAVVAILFVSFLFVGTVDIAGTYISEYTEDVKVDISRKGKLTFIGNSPEEGASVKYSFKIKEAKGTMEPLYYPDYQKGFEFEMTAPEYLVYQDEYFQTELNMIVSMTGLKQKTKDGQITISGKLAADEFSYLSDLGFVDFARLEITQEELTQNIYIDNELFIKR